MPLVCVQQYASRSPSGSLLPLPSSMTCGVVASSTVWSGPASATGGRLGGGVVGGARPTGAAPASSTLMVMVSIPVRPPESCTVTVKTIV